jgi:hypothetical protein
MLQLILEPSLIRRTFCFSLLTYSNWSGSSACLSCPSGTYSGVPGTKALEPEHVCQVLASLRLSAANSSEASPTPEEATLIEESLVLASDDRWSKQC